MVLKVGDPAPPAKGQPDNQSPAGGAPTHIVMSKDQFTSLMDFLHGSRAVPQPVFISDEQFAELKELLMPGYEASKLMLAQYQQPADTPPASDPPPPSSPPQS